MSFFRGLNFLLVLRLLWLRWADSLWKDGLTRANKENMDLLSESMLLYAFSKFRDSKESGNYTINQVLGYLEEHFMEPKISLCPLCRMCSATIPKYLFPYVQGKARRQFFGVFENAANQACGFLMDQGITSIKKMRPCSDMPIPFIFPRYLKRLSAFLKKQYITRDPGAGGLSGKPAFTDRGFCDKLIDMANAGRAGTSAYMAPARQPMF